MNPNVPQPLPIEIQPGMVGAASRLGAEGRWYDGSLVRWKDGVLQPIGGWRRQSTATLTEPCRGEHAWIENDNNIPYAAFGSVDKLHVYSGGDVTDVTPSDLSTGRRHTSFAGGAYGLSSYGRRPYGTGDETSAQIVNECRTWQLDNYGEDLVSCALDDGRIFYMDLSAGVTAPSVLTNAPTDCSGVVVTPERIIVALGAGGDPRLLAWSDTRDITDWTPSLEDNSGDFRLETPGDIYGGAKIRGGTMIFTSADAHMMIPVRDNRVYDIRPLGASGAISRRAWGVAEDTVYWMGPRTFYMFRGTIRRMPSVLTERVFQNMNLEQRHKVWCSTRTDFGEITWFYPSRSSLECDSYVTYNYSEGGVWYTGSLNRTGGIDNNITAAPLMIDDLGRLYQHEIGDEYDGGIPFAESGFNQLEEGGRNMMIRGVYPDLSDTGGANLTLVTEGTLRKPQDRSYGPFALSGSGRLNVRFEARRVAFRIEQTSAGWRFGVPKLEILPGTPI